MATAAHIKNLRNFYQVLLHHLHVNDIAQRPVGVNIFMAVVIHRQIRRFSAPYFLISHFLSPNTSNPIKSMTRATYAFSVCLRPGIDVDAFVRLMLLALFVCRNIELTNSNKLHNAR